MAWQSWVNRRVNGSPDLAQKTYLQNVAGAAGNAGWNPTQVNNTFGSGITLPNPSASSTAIANNPTVRPVRDTPGITSAPVNTPVTPVGSTTITGPGAGIKGGNVGISGGGTNPAAVMPGQQAAPGAFTPGEDSRAYMLRQGMSPADADAALATSKANPNMSYQDIVAKGGYNVPGPLGTVHATDTGYNVQGGVWGPGGFYDPRVGSNATSLTPQNLYNYTALKNTPTKDWFGQPINNTQFANPATFPTGGPASMPGMYPGESTLQYALRMGLNPNEASGFLAQQATGNGPAGGIAPINSGEDPAAYMQRIGMSPAQIQAALAKAQQNPGMSFQQIVSGG